jgi:hypothetical protein
MKRLVCAVEGDGEVQAIPNLCARILLAVGATGWVVDKEPIRRNRSRTRQFEELRQARPGDNDALRGSGLRSRRARRASTALA